MKRIFDLIVSCMSILILSPLFLIVIILVSVKLGSPVFFRQYRPGKNGVPFSMIKFRTMRSAYDEHDCLLPDYMPPVSE